MPSQDVIFGKKASNDPGLCPSKGQYSGVCSRARALNQFSSLSLNVLVVLGVSKQIPG